MKRHLAMLRENEMDGCLFCQDGTAQNPQPRWRRKVTGAPLPEPLRQPTPETRPHQPGMPPVPPSDNEAAHVYKIEGLPPGYVYIHTPLPSSEFSNHDEYAKDRKCIGRG